MISAGLGPPENAMPRAIDPPCLPPANCNGRNAGLATQHVTGRRRDHRRPCRRCLESGRQALPDAKDAQIMLATPLEQLAFIVVKARGYVAEIMPTDDDASNPTDDKDIAV